MKKYFLKNLLVLAFISFTLSGCDLFDKVDDVKFEGILPVNFVISEAGTGAPVVYSETEVLDATDDDEIAKYASKIKEIKLNKITYEIQNYTGGDIDFTDGSLQVGSTGETLATASLVNLQNTAETELTTVDITGFNEFTKQIKDDKKVEIQLDGTFSSTPVAFTLTVYFHVTVTAEAFK